MAQISINITDVTDHKFILKNPVIEQSISLHMQNCLSLDFLLNYSMHIPMKFSKKTLLTSAIAYQSTNSSVCQLPTVSF